MPDAPSVQRILAEAEQRFAATGFGGTSLSSIARAAGLGNAGLLHHFPSKAALYGAVLAAVGEDMDRRSTAAREGLDDPVRRLRALLEVLVVLAEERPTALRLVVQEFLDTSGRIAAASRLPLAGPVRDAVAAITDGQTAGQVVEGDPYALVARLHGTVVYGALGKVVLGRIAEEGLPEDWSALLVEAALAGVLVPATR